MGYSPWSRKESDMTEKLSLSFILSHLRKLGASIIFITSSCLSLGASDSKESAIQETWFCMGWGWEDPLE